MGRLDCGIFEARGVSEMQLRLMAESCGVVFASLTDGSATKVLRTLSLLGLCLPDYSVACDGRGKFAMTSFMLAQLQSVTTSGPLIPVGVFRMSSRGGTETTSPVFGCCSMSDRRDRSW